MSSTRPRAGERSVLGDATGLANTRPSRARRNSFCVSNRSSDHEETPSKPDRRALLAKWRRDRETPGSGGGTHPSGIPSSSEHDNKKRSRFHDTPPLPPSAPSSTSNAFVAGDRNSTRDRIKQRKQQKRLHHGDESPSATTPVVPAKSSIEYFDDEEERYSSRGISGRSPLLRKSLGGARRRSLSLSSARRGRASPSLSQESDGEYFVVVLPRKDSMLSSRVSLLFILKILVETFPLQYPTGKLCRRIRRSWPTTMLKLGRRRLVFDLG